jgi:hypothetical protein
MVDQLNARCAVLLIPDRQHLGLVTYEAKDPATSFPPIEPLLPPEGATNAPHHGPQEWADKYAGQFADGWTRSVRRSSSGRSSKGWCRPRRSDG